MRRRVIAVSLVLTGCLWPTEPRLDADVRVPDALTAETNTAGDFTWLAFEVPVTITNTGDSALRFHGCISFSVEEAADSRTVWRPICMLMGGVAEDVQPGVTRDWILQVGATLSGPAGPDWDAESVEGTYRVRMSFSDASGGRSTTRVSNAFDLRAD